MEKQQKLAFCMASRAQPRRLKPANCLADDEDTSPRSTPAPRQFITEFISSSSKTQTTAAAPAIIAPLPNARLFRRERPPLAGATDEGIVTTERDGDPRSAADDGHAYGLNLPAAADKEAPPQVASTSELLRRRFKHMTWPPSLTTVTRRSIPISPQRGSPPRSWPATGGPRAKGSEGAIGTRGTRKLCPAAAVLLGRKRKGRRLG